VLGSKADHRYSVLPQGLGTVERPQAQEAGGERREGMITNMIPTQTHPDVTLRRGVQAEFIHLAQWIRL
jgi:hypothetical protein